MNAEHLAQEADRLKADPILLQAISDAQKDAMHSLVTVDAANTIEILRLQAEVKAYDGILTQLEYYILRRPQNSGTLTGPLA